MTDDRAAVSSWAIRGLYFFTFILVFWPVTDLITNTWPIQLGNLQWRYGFMGLLAVLLFFALDVVQLRNTVPAERLPSFQAGALIAELKHFTSFVALALLGIGGWKTAAPMEAGDSKLSNELNIVMKHGAKTGR